MTTPTPSIITLQRALAVAEQIAKLEAELTAILGGSSAVPSAARKAPAAQPSKSSRRTMSHEVRVRMALAQKARWAKIKGDKTPAAAGKTSTKVKAKRSGLTPAGRASLAAKMKARWAARKSAAPEANPVAEKTK